MNPDSLWPDGVSDVGLFDPLLLCRLRARGLGPGRLHTGPALSAPGSGAGLQAEAELAVRQTYVSHAFSSIICGYEKFP